MTKALPSMLDMRSIDEAAVVLGLTTSQVHRLVVARELPSWRLTVAGGIVRIEEDGLFEIADDGVAINPTTNSCSGRYYIHVDALTVFMEAHGLGSSRPAGMQEARDRGARIKRKALIDRNMRRWPKVERDVKDAARNGLRDAARDTAVGWWWEGDALAWARARGRLESEAPAIDRLVHRTER